MIPGIMTGPTTLLFIVCALAIIGLAFLAIFRNSIYNRLSTRIIALIFASGLVAITISFILEKPLTRSAHPFRLHLLQTALTMLGGPIILGLLAARFVQRPLNYFNNAVTSLKQNNYKIQLQPTGIREFDEVFTKLNELTIRLEQEEKLRKDLVSDTSHELNTPLTVMIGQLTAIQEGKYRMTKERVALLKEQAERLAELVRQLDTYTKARAISSGEPEDIDVRQLCQQLVDQFTIELQQKGITTQLHITNDLRIRANRDSLQRILANLLQNTLRYAEASEVIVSATEHGLTFSDNGKGVPPESLTYLFERFYRVDSSRNKATGGLGLGLAIVRELAEQQGWRVTAKNAQPGLTFEITF